VSHADNAHNRATDSAGVIETLLGRKLIPDDSRIGSGGRPAFWSNADWEARTGHLLTHLHIESTLSRRLTIRDDSAHSGAPALSTAS
jgi:hypothetical protein